MDVLASFCDKRDSDPLNLPQENKKLVVTKKHTSQRVARTGSPLETKVAGCLLKTMLKLFLCPLRFCSFCKGHPLLQRNQRRPSLLCITSTMNFSFSVSLCFKTSHFLQEPQKLRASYLKRRIRHFFWSHISRWFTRQIFKELAVTVTGEGRTFLLYLLLHL